MKWAGHVARKGGIKN